MGEVWGRVLDLDFGPGKRIKIKRKIRLKNGQAAAPPPRLTRYRRVRGRSGGRTKLFGTGAE